MFAPHCSLIAISGGEGAFPPLAVCPTRVSFPLKSRAPPPGPFSASSHPLGWASGDVSSHSSVSGWGGRGKYSLPGWISQAELLIKGQCPSPPRIPSSHQSDRPDPRPALWKSGPVGSMPLCLISPSALSPSPALCPSLMLVSGGNSLGQCSVQKTRPLPCCS